MPNARSRRSDAQTADPRSCLDDRTSTVRRERPQRLAVAFRILGSDADAQDVVQEGGSAAPGRT
jgi:DNA-directed RNA polymerase specialized sigma24 family protein